MKNRELEIHQCISQQMVGLLESGIVPWHTTWKEVPSNLLTKRPYRGINVLLLAAKEYDRNYFLTESQIERVGAYVYKGQKPHVIVDGIGFRSLRPYEVYNIEQCGDIPKILVPRCPQQNSPIENCKKIVEGMDHCPRLIHEHEYPYYDLSEDVINMPPMSYIESREEYFAIFFKQIAASTKHPMRLGMPNFSPFKGLYPDASAMEDLVVEIGAWYLRSHVGIEGKQHFDNCNIQYWIGMFKKNLRLAFEASEMAQEVVEYILGQSFDEKEAIDYVEDEMLPF